MARIRSIKPQFFRHEELQALEESHPQNRPMLVFAGLFTVADREGRFEWRPKQIKLDILPFLEFDMGETLELLASNAFIVKYSHGGKQYGYISTFLEHQCPNKKEPASRIPAPYQHSTSTVPTRGEVEVEREREEEGEIPEGPSIIFRLAKAHPKLTHLRDESEIPHGVADAIIQAIEKDGEDVVLAGTVAYAENVDDPKFALDPYKFFTQFIYRRSHAKPVGKFTQLLSTVSEPYSEPGEQFGTTRDR